MEKQAILHKTKSNYAYAYDAQTLHFRLRSKRDDLLSVTLLIDHEDGWLPNEKGVWMWQKKQVTMRKEFSTELFDYWFAEIQPHNLKARYGFLLDDGQTQVLFVERGFFSPDDEFIQNDINSYFSFPYIHENDLFVAPAWVKETVWYQIFPERFANGDVTNDPQKTHAWSSASSAVLGEFEFYGGDLRGIINKLPYLADLGISGIYLTPIFKSPTSHKYDTEDYFEIDPHFGTKEDLRELVDKAHQLGIRIMLDAVFNHIGWTSYQFKDAQTKGKTSKYYDWFYFEEDSYLNFSYHMPKLNTSHPEVIDYLIQVASYWILEADIDGWRLDVANEVDHQFWKKFRAAVKSIKPDVYICGELWHDSQAWLNGDQFDGVMNYPLAKPIQEWLATERLNGYEFLEQFVHAYTRYPKNQNLGMMTLLDSHDTPRIITSAQNDYRKVDMCFALLATTPGSICFYYGSEIYLQGEDDPDNRRCMNWEVTPTSNIAKLTQLRKNYPTVGYAGEYDFLSVTDYTIIFKKCSIDETIYFVFHTKGRETVDVPKEMQGQTFVELIHSQLIPLSEQLQLDEYSYLILKKS
ncbi:cyclomaltodextrinase/maltogenic alpha-amylase/neopullulanase [Enterococcus sp. DIV2402]|uniref:Cyclomaltodextrinase/maltogenic alpha-amylase/neopullulanase n=1 Tax=Candidatus Enterococcus lowellii TaxID=2230877 RepID=A0ABZ2SQB3_9ENTE|nr:glycoside hydrolase family 13 protein [Enterococcus sp. DIV2402]MBO0465669.1 alpha-glycosidase [Enterococcus sp. DIV2402]